MKAVSPDIIGSIFTQALLEIISKVTGFSLDVISAERDGGFDEFAAFMSLNGLKSGVLFISAGETSLRTLCSYMVGTPEKDITKEDIEDVLCEFVNMTAGNAKLRLDDTEYMYTLSSPHVISGREMSIAAKNRVNIISKTLRSGDVSVKLKVIV